MADRWMNIIEKIFSIKSLVTLALTGVLVYVMVADVNPGKEILALFCTSYGSVITYFFTKKDQQ